jgi:CheY-like chemotaxis protein
MNSIQGSPDRHASQEVASQSIFQVTSFTGAAVRATVLIVDDNQRNRFALTALLQRYGMTVLTAASGAAALETLDQRVNIDMVLMDITMPVMDGYQTMTAIRRRPTCTDLPIIAITANDANGERNRCIAAGASDYIPKPINPGELLTLIDHQWPAKAAAAAAAA